MGRKRVDTQEFIRRAKERWGDRFDYSKAVYTKANEKVTIICKIHGEFSQRAIGHTNGRGCKKCGVEKRSKERRSTTEEFVEKALKKHGNLYDYSKVNYLNNSTKVEIICKEHGAFLQTPAHHLSGTRCPKCFGNKIPTTDEWIQRAKTLHSEKYDYSKSTYVNQNVKITIECPEHGEFRMLPNNHLIHRQGCPECGKFQSSQSRRLGNEKFVDLAERIHGKRYDYSQVEYITSDDHVDIICNEHGLFTQSPHNHIWGGNGCPECGVTGFKQQRAAHYYVHAISHIESGEIICYKGGISGQWETRLRTLQYHLPEKYVMENVEILFFEVGTEALAFETMLLQAEEIRAPEQNFDGGHELFLENPLQYARENGWVN